MRSLLAFAMLLVLLSGCYKDNVDVSELNTNPFDRDYAGPAVFEFQETFLQTVNIGGTNVLYQVIVFRVKEELFLAPASYSVQLRDLQNEDPNATATPVSPGSSLYRYQRAPAPGQQICLELQLFNNQSGARAETICATL